jgi:capsular exopolysaccharide synthesis family protein
MKVLQALRQDWPMATEIHKLETRLWRQAKRDQLQIFLVTSAVRGEGKSTMVAYLATALALHPGRNILAMDLDFRSPTLNSHFDLEINQGLEDVLRGECSITDAIVRSPLRNGESGLDLVFPGKGSADPQVLLNSPKLLEIFQTLRASYDLIVMDSPPLIPVADATALIPHSDAVILTVMAGVTTKHHLTRARELCLGLGANICGIVVGNVQEAAPEYMDSYYAYPDAGSKKSEPKASRQPKQRGQNGRRTGLPDDREVAGYREAEAPKPKGKPGTGGWSESKR